MRGRELETPPIEGFRRRHVPIAEKVVECAPVDREIGRRDGRFDRAAVVKAPFSGAGQRQTDIEALTAYVVEASRGMPIKVPQGHPMEKAAFERGKYLFYMRGGPYDFACSTCHGVDNQRIRLQDLPNFEKKEPAQRAFATWPAYRVSQGALRTMQWRLNDCFRQQRFPEPVFVSQATIDLITFLGVKAEGRSLESIAQPLTVEDTDTGDATEDRTAARR